MKASPQRQPSKAACLKLLGKLINHDIQGTLSAQMGINDILLSDGEDLPPDQRTQMVDLMASSSRKLLHEFRVIQLVFSIHFLPKERETVLLKEVVHSLLSEHQEALDKAGKSVDGTACNGTVTADENWIRFILGAMLQNALSYGGMRIALCLDSPDEGVVRLSCLDDGPPVDEDQKPLFFTPLDQWERRAQRNIGLGTSLIRLVAESLDGSCGFDRQDGWNRFYIQFPEGIE